MQFIKQLRQELGRPLIMILDRLAAHRSAAKQLHNARYKDIRFEWLPAYAPDLNHVDALWSYTKCPDLANFLPHDEHDLRRSVCESIEAQRRQKHLLRSFFQAAKLKL